MMSLPAPLNDKNKLIMYLSMYEDEKFRLKPTKRRVNSKKIGKIPILENTSLEVKPEFLKEITEFKKLIEKGVHIERAICLVRHSQGPLLFDRLSIDTQELFILFMEKEWGKDSK